MMKIKKCIHLLLILNESIKIVLMGKAVTNTCRGLFDFFRREKSNTKIIEGFQPGFL